MASVAPTVTRTSVSASSSRPYQARWWAATAWRSSGMPPPGGYWFRPSRMAATAISRSSSGPSVSGKPCPRLTAPVSVASSDMVAKMVVVNGRRRRARYASPVATATIVPVARRWPPIVGGHRAQHRQLQHALRDGRVGQALRLCRRHRAPSTADVIVLEESWTTEGRAEGQAEEAARALGYQVVTHTIGSGRRISPQPDPGDTWVARPAWSAQQPCAVSRGAAPVPRERPCAGALAAGRARDVRHRGARPAGPSRSSAHGSCPMSVLRADRVERAALVVDLTVEGRPISVDRHPHVPPALRLAIATGPSSAAR